jgi:putative secretion ATPase (PEP-CTERM system associated)
MLETFYGFSGNPFLVNPDPSLYFESKGHRQAHASLTYGVLQGEGFMVMTGEIGAGKTTLVRTLLRELDPSVVLAVQLVSTQLDSDDLLRAVALAFGLPVENTTKASLLGTIETFLSSLVRQHRRALLIVDEAQNLGARAMEELRMLSNFQLGDHSMLQSILVGQPELRRLMGDPSMRQLRQRIIASCHLGPLDPAETRAYIEHRLHQVGWKGDPSFEPRVFEAVHLSTGGIPRRVNLLCSRMLLRAYLAHEHKIGLANVTEAANEVSEDIGNETPVSNVPASPSATELRTGDVVRPFIVSSITARLDRLEKNVNTVLELVRAMASSDDRTRAGGNNGNKAKRA